MTTESQIEMLKPEYHNEIRKLKDQLEDRNYRLMEIQKIYTTLEALYNDTSKYTELTYRHKEIDDTNTGWLYKINELSYIK